MEALGWEVGGMTEDHLHHRIRTADMEINDDEVSLEQYWSVQVSTCSIERLRKHWSHCFWLIDGDPQAGNPQGYLFAILQIKHIKAP